MRRIVAQPLTPAAWAPYGHVIAADPTRAPRSGNQGRAQVWDHLAPLVNDRPGARPNLGLFRTGPWPSVTLALRLLERHPRSTQVFVPMSASRTLLVVAPPGSPPTPEAVVAFVAGPVQGIAYHPGTWHHPLVALDTPADHACLVWEDGTDGDCEIVDVSGWGVEVGW